MTPKEKAKELVNKFDLPSGLMSIERKQCAIIAVDEQIKLIESMPNKLASTYTKEIISVIILELKEVKNEIEKL